MISIIIMSTLEERLGKYRCYASYRELYDALHLSDDSFKIMRQINDTVKCDKFIDFSDVRKSHYDYIENLPGGNSALLNLSNCFGIHGLDCMQTYPISGETIMKSINANKTMTFSKIDETLRK